MTCESPHHRSVRVARLCFAGNGTGSDGAPPPRSLACPEIRSGLTDHMCRRTLCLSTPSLLAAVGWVAVGAVLFQGRITGGVRRSWVKSLFASRGFPPDVST